MIKLLRGPAGMQKRLFYPVFMARRLIFVIVPLLISDKPMFQAAILILQ